MPLSAANYILNQINGRPHIQPPLCKGCGSPVETSAFNAEAPTEPAGETVGCRRQLGGIVRLILYAFVKFLSHFLFPKNDSSLYKGAFCGQGRALSLRYVLIFLCDFSHKLSYFSNNPTAAASHRPTALDMNFNLCPNLYQFINLL